VKVHKEQRNGKKGVRDEDTKDMFSVECQWVFFLWDIKNGRLLNGIIRIKYVAPVLL
jgi:hypothetical protein